MAATDIGALQQGGRDIGAHQSSETVAAETKIRGAIVRGVIQAPR